MKVFLYMYSEDSKICFFVVVVVVVKNTKLKDVYETMCVFANMLNTHDVFIKTKFPWSSKKEIN